MQKSDSEETDGPKPHVKLRRAVSENPRPASTPPTIASTDKDDREEDRIAAELEVLRPFPRDSYLCNSLLNDSEKLHILLCSFPSEQIYVTTLSICRWQPTCSPLPHVQAAGTICHPSPRLWWAEPEIPRCSLTHIITQGSQITGRQMDPGDAVCVTLSPWNHKIQPQSTKIVKRKKNKKQKTLLTSLTPAVANLSFSLDSSLRELHPGWFCPVLVLSWLASEAIAACRHAGSWPPRYRSHYNDLACCGWPCLAPFFLPASRLLLKLDLVEMHFYNTIYN